MLHRIKSLLVDLEDITYITYNEYDDDGDDIYYVLDIFTNTNNIDTNDYFTIILDKEELVKTWEDLKTYKSLFYEITLDTLINLRNISGIQYLTDFLQITFKSESISDKNLKIEIDENTDANRVYKILDEMSKVQWKNGNGINYILIHY